MNICIVVRYLAGILITIMMLSESSVAQVENVPVGNPVYQYLKDMRLRGLLEKYDDGISDLSRFEVVNYLNEIERSFKKLSNTERSLLRKYLTEFDPGLMNENTTMSLFGGNYKMARGFDEVFSDKQKYLFAYHSGENNIFFRGGGHLGYSNRLSPDTKPNGKVYDVGFDIRGTVFGKLGYYFYVLKGATAGDTAQVENIYPQLRANFKYLENIENVRSYDNVRGYLKYYTEPDEGMSIAGQFGREKVKLGYGYGSSLILSGNAPDMDFLRLVFRYGIINYYSFFGAGLGPYNRDNTKNYTKYLASNRLMLSFPGLFDIGIGETVVFSDRIELAYLNPVIFYKFVEHSLQDRDNGAIYFDLQTHFLRDFEFQGTFYLDENILSNLDDFSKSSNKTAYQAGIFWYRPAGLENFGVAVEYTKIRPYVYTHFNIKNNYTSFGQIIGQPIGPNSDQIFTSLSFNASSRLRFAAEYQKIRSGENVYSTDGTLEKNVGGDVDQAFRPGIDPDNSYFLDGIRVNRDVFNFLISYEPIRDFRFDLNFSYNMEKNLSAGTSSKSTSAYGLFSLIF